MGNRGHTYETMPVILHRHRERNFFLRKIIRKHLSVYFAMPPISIYPIPSSKGYFSSGKEEVPKGAKEVRSKAVSASCVGFSTKRIPFFSSTSRIRV